ncbi:putative amidoligase [Rostrohypoxylon terebratum]|nr:putative amidoligase [Rostrohypoxylon terebratum]
MPASTESSAEPRPDRTTFGVELEFLVPWLRPRDRDPLGGVEGLAPLFRLTGTIPDPEKEVHEAIRKLFQDHGLETRIDVKTREYKSTYAEQALDRYSAWTVKYDISVQEEDDSNDWLKKYGWASVEVISPVEPTIPIAFEILDYARKLLINTFRCRVNKTCGLHVHVGKGSERFDLANMRRISALVWSSEHLFVNLNHPNRQANHLTPTARKKTAISTGRGQGEHDRKQLIDLLDQCKDYVATDVRYGEEPISFRDENRDLKTREAFAQTREPGHYEPFQWRFPDGQVHDANVPMDKLRDIDEEILNRVERMSVKTDFRGSTEIESDPSRERTMRKMENIR